MTSCISDSVGQFVFLRKPGEFAPSAVRVAISADATLESLLQEFTTFVIACGYHVPDGAFLDFVDKDGKAVER
jgi:hypothetical protein